MSDHLIERFLKAAIWFTALAASAALWWPAGARASTRIKEVASVQGVRSNQLVGYGLVVGLDGTGDQSQGAPFTGSSVQADRPAATLQMDDGFDRAWRRVGVALDRSGFTVEDRDRTQGVYFVRYIDPAFAGKEEPNLFQKLFSFGKKDADGGPARYRVVVKSEGEQSTVAVLNGKGEPENGEAGKRITSLLLEDLK